MNHDEEQAAYERREQHPTKDRPVGIRLPPPDAWAWTATAERKKARPPKIEVEPSGISGELDKILP